MKFGAPYWLLGGLAACGLLAWLFYRNDRRQRIALAAFASSHLLEKLTASISPFRRKVKRGLLLFGLAALFIALARPQAGFRWEETRQRSVDILLAVDTSKSMLTQDVKPDRLTRAKMAVDDLANRLDGDRLGLVAFAGEAFLQCPLTLDQDAFQESVDALDTTTIPRGGTNLARAIREADDAFRAEGGNSKLLILLTDGEELEDSGIEAAKEAAKDGLKIDTIGVGTPEGDLIPVPNQNGGTDFLHDATGQIVKSHLDESTLKQIAETTGGTYRPLGPRGEGITQLYEEELASLSHDQEATRKIRVPLEQFQWPLALGLLALLAEPLIGTRRRIEIRPVSTEPPRKRWLPRSRQGGLTTPPATALLLCLALTIFGVKGALMATPEAGEEAFQKGDYAKAQQEFEKAAQRTSQPELQLDLGSAAYKNNQYDKASEAYQKTLQTERLNVQQQAYYNLGDTLYRQGQQTEKSDTKQTIQTWQQAIQAYENALKLRPDDADAKFNRDFVKRKLDELQKKPPQGGQSNKNDQNKSDQSKDQQQQNQNQNQNSNSKSDQNQNQGQSQNQNQSQNQDQNSSQQQNPAQGNPSQNQNQQGQQGQQNQNQNPNPGQNPQPSPQNQNGQDQSQPQPQPQPDNGQNSGQNPKPSNADNSPQQENSKAGTAQAVPGQMTKDEAKNLLNSVRGNDKILPLSQKGKGADEPPEKDW